MKANLHFIERIPKNAANTECETNGRTEFNSLQLLNFIYR